MNIKCLILRASQNAEAAASWARRAQGISYSVRCGLLPHCRSITLTTTQRLKIDLWHLINGTFRRFNTIIETIWG